MTFAEDVSLCNWDQDDEFELHGPHMFVCSGFSAIPLALSEGLNLQLSTPVLSIHHQRSDEVYVTTDNNSYKCDACLVTVPLGVLKDKTALQFNPELPDWKTGAIERLGYGNINKVVLCFESTFWQSTPQLFGHVASTSGSRGEFFLFWAVYRQPTLVVLSSGHAANILEHTSDGVIVAKCVSILKGIFGASTVKPLKDAIVTRWAMDEWSRGAYSYVAKGSSGGNDYDAIARPITSSGLFFAGEHTNRNYPATVHGAMLSGFRAAREIADFLLGAQHDTNSYEL